MNNLFFPEFYETCWFSSTRLVEAYVSGSPNDQMKREVKLVKLAAQVDNRITEDPNGKKGL